jgi:CubicO group peptidase (beta-lactamase class C family)
MASLERTRAVLERGMADGLHLGAQLCVSHNGGRTDLTVGDARSGVPMRPDTVNHWLSAGKPLAAVAIAQLWERDLLDLDDSVAKHLPAFGNRGKERVTIRHVLTHTGGFRGWGTDWDRPLEAVLADVMNLPLEAGWEPGQKAGYHPASSWFVLGGLIRALDGRPFDAYVREMIAEPLHMSNAWVGLPPTQFERYEREGRLSFNYKAEPRLDLHEPLPSAEAMAHPSPGGGLRATARDLVAFYEMMLARGAAPGGQRVLLPQTAEAITARHRVGLIDRTFGRVMDFGLGVIVNSDYADPTKPMPYGYGPHASIRTFGHGGNQSSNAFADPERALAVAWVCNGTPGEPRHQDRNRAVNAAVYEDLGLT